MRRTWAAALGVLVVLGAGGGAVRADFVLTGTQHMDVSTEHDASFLWGFSTADILCGGLVRYAYVHDQATLSVRADDALVRIASVYERGAIRFYSGWGLEVNAYGASSVAIFGGTIWDAVRAYGSSTVARSGGDSMHMAAYESSRVEMSGGLLHSGVDAHDNSNVVISGGILACLRAWDSSTTVLQGRDCEATDGLVLDGELVLGTGTLTGKWFDGTSWAIIIHMHDPSATIRAIPEPATLALVALGGLALVARRRK